MIGDNGVLTQSQQASTKTNKATEFETIQLSVAGSFNDEGYLDLTTLVTNLTNEMPIGTVIETEKDNEDNNIFPVKIIAKYGKYTIDGNGKAEEVNGVEISPKSLKLLEETTGNLTANLFGDSIGETVTWTATDGAMFNDNEITATGLNVTVKAIAGKIIAQVAEKTSECTVTVVGNVQSAEGLTSLSGMATKKLNVLNKITNKDSIEDITFSLDSTNTTTTGASVDSTTGIVTLGNFTTGTSGKVTVILTGVLSNLTKSVEITVTPLQGPRVGDFVDYHAGVWTQEEIDALNTAGLYAGATKTETAYTFSGFDVGDDKDFSIISDTNHSRGWRVYKINNDGTVNIIHSGCPEYFCIPNVIPEPRQQGYIGQYVLGGGLDSSLSADDVEGLNVRLFGEYDNGEYAIDGTGRSVDYDGICSYVQQKSEFASTGGVYPYWIPLSYTANQLKYVHAGYFGQSNGYPNGICYGVRPVVTLQSGINWTSEDSTHTTYETRWMVEE